MGSDETWVFSQTMMNENYCHCFSAFVSIHHSRQISLCSRLLDNFHGKCIILLGNKVELRPFTLMMPIDDHLTSSVKHALEHGDKQQLMIII